MRYLVVLFALLCGAAHAQWTSEQRTLSAMYMTAHVIDWGQTRTISRDGWDEYNPILGRHPSLGKVNTYFSITPLLGYLVLDHLDSPNRTFWLRVITTVEIANVGRNAVIGIRVKF